MKIFSLVLPGMESVGPEERKTKAPEMILMKIMICRNMVLKINLV
jgi:hypothetical protein